MSLSNTQLQTLKTELVTDPTNLNYALLSDAAAADAINAVNLAITIRRRDITPQELLEAIAVADLLTTANNIQCSWFESLLQAQRVRLSNDDGTDTTVLTNLKVLVTGAGSRTRLQAVSTRIGSRAEQIFTAGVVINLFDINAARKLP